MKKNVLILAGPTAAGKTDTAVQLAIRLNGEIISADSMQIYRYMDIGTAKPTLEERQGIIHHLIDIVNPDEDFSAAEFQKEALKKIEEISGKNKLPIITGGTGLYINSLIYKMDFTSAVSNRELRKQLQEETVKKGSEYLHNKLKKLDPEAAGRIHPNNVKRVIRALEVNMESGEKMGDFRRDPKPNPDYKFALAGLTRNREELYQRIDMRADTMLKKGLTEEVKNLLNMGYSENLISFKGLGYKEIISYLNGKYDLDEAVRILKRNTRHYAKRQLTWFRSINEMKWFNLSEYGSEYKLLEEIISYIEGYFSSIQNTN